MPYLIRTDRRLQSLPWMNHALIALNIIIFIATKNQIAASTAAPIPAGGFESLQSAYPVVGYYLYPNNPKLFQFITYQFLHGSWTHLLSNMIFLYMFGNSVEDRLGKIGYLAFYLSAGIIAGLGHAAVELNSVLGASGAVSGVTGMYLALFPLSNVIVTIPVFFLGVFEVSSVVLIVFQILQNLTSQLLGLNGVAYLAHLHGYAFGFAIGMLTLYTKLLPREPYDMLALIERHRRRSEYRVMRRAANANADPNTLGNENTNTYTTTDPLPDTRYKPRRLSRTVWTYRRSKENINGGKTSAEERQVTLQDRKDMIAALVTRDLPTAARLYRQLLTRHPGQVMPEHTQLDIANQLFQDAQYPAAAQAYDLFLNAYPTYNQREQVHLVLGLLCARFLDEPDRAARLLDAALTRLTNPDEIALARQTRAAL